MTLSPLLATIFSPHAAIYAVCVLVVCLMLASYPWDDGTGAAPA